MFPQLADTYNPIKVYPNFQWLASPKLDGIRCLYYAPNKGLTSRTQRLRYVGFEEIEQICESLRINNNLSFLDGELYIPGEKFDVISGIVRDTKDYDVSAKARVEFRVFAVGSIANPNMTAESMLDLMKSALSDTGRVNYLPHSVIPNIPIAVQTEAELVKSSGRSDEGIMLRNPSSVYPSTLYQIKVNRICFHCFQAPNITSLAPCIMSLAPCVTILTPCIMNQAPCITSLTLCIMMKTYFY